LERRLAAILAADLVGYTRLMGSDEAGTLQRLTELRQQVLEPLIADHHGRIVKLIGDGLLVEFASVVDAVTCAVTWQNAVAEREREAKAGSALQFRIGINLGDVIVEGDDIHGDGVNVATRLEGFAEPGAICLSGDAYRQVRGKIEAEFEDLGEQKLKNVAELVAIYRVANTRTFESASSLAIAPRPDQPSIAVLSFANLSDDPGQQYFSDGITEDIITELSRFRSLFVMARISSIVFKSKAMSARDLAHGLGVEYVVEGSVRRAGDRVRITAQLINVATGAHLWGERYDREMRDVFAVQDEVARSIASATSGRVEAAGRERAERLSPTALRAYDLVLRAKALTSRYTREDNQQALACAERAVKLDTTSARAHAHSAWCHFFNHMAGWVPDRENALAQAYELAQRAIVLDETDSFPHAILGAIYWFRREYDEARSELETAISLNPNDPEARRYYGGFLAATGNPDAAIEQIELAKQLNPFDTRWVPWIQGIVWFTARRYDKAIASLKRARDPINEVRGWLAASYAQAGREEEARTTLREFLRVAEADMVDFPGHRLEDWKPYWHGAFEYQDQNDFEHLFDALRKAGLQE